MSMGAGLRTVALFAALSALSGCTGSEEASPVGWRKVGDLDGAIIFVEADPKVMRSAKQYFEAANRACGSGCFQVAFFQPGDLIPPSGSRSEFFSHGGWNGYSPVALKFEPDFTVWNCDKLNFPDAPQSALCGENAEGAYSAILSIAVRDGWTMGCHLEEFGGFAVVKTYAESLHREAQRKHTLDAYRQMYESSRSGPDDPGFCTTGRQKIQDKADDAKALLEKLSST